MAHAVGQGQEQAVMGKTLVLDRAAHLEVQTVAGEDERDVVERVRIPFAEFVGPDHECVVEQAAAAAGLWGLSKALDQVGHLLAIPLIDPDELFLRLLVAIGVVREFMVALSHAKPSASGRRRRNWCTEAWPPGRSRP